MVLTRDVTINGPIGTIAWSVPLDGELTYGAVYFRLNNIASFSLNFVVETAPTEGEQGPWALVTQFTGAIPGSVFNFLALPSTNYGALRVQLRSPLPDGADVTFTGFFHQPFKK